MPKVSVIIPIYGVEQYIERCARSLFEQTIDDVEFIFVDDCTNDNSIEILNAVIEQYPSRKNQMTILKHEINKGLPTARKTGLNIAKGEYIIHCDSDDWIDRDMYLSMYNLAVSTDADVVISDYKITDGISILKICCGCRTNDSKKYIENLFYQRNNWVLWNKMFKKTIYCHDDILYPTGSMGEDMSLCIELMWYCKKIEYINKPLYYYFFNPTSITKIHNREAMLRKFTENTDNALILQSFFKNKHISQRWSNLLEWLYYRAGDILISEIRDAEIYRMWRKHFENKNIQLFINPQYPLVRKIRHALVFLKILQK